MIKTLQCLLIAAGLPVLAATGLHGQTLLLNWNFDEAAAGTAPTTDHGANPQVDGRFFNDATRTANTPAGFSPGAMDATAQGNASVLANYSNPNVASLDGKLDNLTSFTLSLWVNMQSNPVANQRIVRAGSAAGFGIRVVNPEGETATAGNYGLTLDLAGGGVPMDFSVGSDNRWTFLAFTFDSSLPDNQVKLYVGTETETVYLAAEAGTNVDSTGVLDTHLTLGRHPSLSNRGVPAFLDDLRIYSGAADASYIEELRLANIPEPGTMALLAGLAVAGLLMFRRLAGFPSGQP